MRSTQEWVNGQRDVFVFCYHLGCWLVFAQKKQADLEHCCKVFYKVRSIKSN
jgi:hypothetical protein